MHISHFAIFCGLLPQQHMWYYTAGYYQWPHVMTPAGLEVQLLSSSIKHDPVFVIQLL